MLRVMVLAVVVAGAPGLADGASGELRVRAEVTPPRLLLPTQQTAALSLEVLDPAGVPVSGARPDVLARKGTVGDVQEIGNGRYRATYRPPEQAYPQLEILVFRIDGRVAGWVSFPLHGTGEIEVETDAGAMVHLEVAGKEFGPVQADLEGRARMKFTAPPGVRQGTVVTGARRTRTARRSVDLGVPQTRPMLLVSDEDRLVADGSSRTGVDLFALDGENRPLEGFEVRFETDSGSLSGVTMLAAGRYRSVFTAPDKVGKGHAVIEAAVPGLGEAYRALLRVGLRPGPAAKLELEVDPATLKADGRSRSLVTVRVADRTDNPVSDAEVRLTASAGDLSAPEKRPGGTWCAWLRAPSTPAPKSAGLRARAVSPGASAAEGQAEIALEATTPAKPQPPAMAETAGRDLSLYRWISLGAGLAALVPGLVLVGLDGQETCDAPAPVRCPEVYDTAFTGWILAGAGAALLTTSLVLTLLDGADPEDRVHALQMSYTPGAFGVSARFSF